MRKMWVIAAREYNAAVRTKAFIVSLILLPVMMGGSAFVQILTKKYGADIRERKVAIIDRTPGQQLFDNARSRREVLSPLPATSLETVLHVYQNW